MSGGGPPAEPGSAESSVGALRFDLVAGLTAASVVLPKAYATVAGLPVAVGLYTALGLNPGVLEVVRRSGLAERLGRERLLFNARAAIERYQALGATPLVPARSPGA